jgi:DNA-binding LytR/AlgR family response regulator
MNHHISPASCIHIGGYAHVPAEEILFCQGDSNYTHVHFVKRHKMTVATTLGILEERLIAEGFVRVNRSELVNRHHIENYDGYQITLTNGTTLPISRRRRKGVRQLLESWLGIFQTKALQYA